MFFIMTLLRPGYSENFPFRNLGIYCTTAFVNLFRIFRNYLFFDCWVENSVFGTKPY